MGGRSHLSRQGQDVLIGTLITVLKDCTRYGALRRSPYWSLCPSDGDTS